MPAHRIRHLFYLCFVLVAALGVAACGSSRSTTVERPAGKLPSGFPNHSAQAIHQALVASSDSVDAFTASGRVELHTPEDQNAYNAQIQQRTNDSLFVSLSPGWGIVAARGLATHDSVFVYDRFHHRLYYGAMASVERILPELASLSALFDNLTGTVIPTDDRTWQVEADSAHYLLTSGERFRTHRLRVDPRMWRVVGYEVETPDGVLLEERSYSDFRRVDGVYMPYEITVRRPTQETQLIVRYKSIHPNPEQLAISFPSTPGAERIPLMNEIE